MVSWKSARNCGLLMSAAPSLKTARTLASGVRLRNAVIFLSLKKLEIIFSFLGRVKISDAGLYFQKADIISFFRHGLEFFFDFLGEGTNLTTRFHYFPKAEIIFFFLCKLGICYSFLGQVKILGPDFHFLTAEIFLRSSSQDISFTFLGKGGKLDSDPYFLKAEIFIFDSGLEIFFAFLRKATNFAGAHHFGKAKISLFLYSLDILIVSGTLRTVRTASTIAIPAGRFPRPYSSQVVPRSEGPKSAPPIAAAIFLAGLYLLCLPPGDRSFN